MYKAIYRQNLQRSHRRNRSAFHRRAIILVHGSSFCSLTCDKQQGYVVTLADMLAQYGYVCFSANYRLFPSKEARPPYAEAAVYAAEDIETARRWIVSNAARSSAAGARTRT